jgi:hypothetical protein
MKNAKIGFVGALLVASAALLGVVAWRGDGIANASKAPVTYAQAPRLSSLKTLAPAHYVSATTIRLPESVAASSEAPSALPPVEEPDWRDLRHFPLGRRHDLDERIAAEAPDETWRGEMVTAIDEKIASWPNAKVLMSQCGQTLCRMEFSASAVGKTTEEVMSAVYNMSDIHGELMMEGDERSDPPTITAYFTRRGDIHLNKPQPRPSNPTQR